MHGKKRKIWKILSNAPVKSLMFASDKLPPLPQEQAWGLLRRWAERGEGLTHVACPREPVLRASLDGLENNLLTLLSAHMSGVHVAVLTFLSKPAFKNRICSGLDLTCLELLPLLGWVHPLRRHSVRSSPVFMELSAWRDRDAQTTQVLGPPVPGTNTSIYVQTAQQLDLQWGPQFAFFSWQHVLTLFPSHHGGDASWLFTGAQDASIWSYLFCQSLINGYLSSSRPYKQGFNVLVCNGHDFFSIHHTRVFSRNSKLTFLPGRASGPICPTLAALSDVFWQ